MAPQLLKKQGELAADEKEQRRPLETFAYDNTIVRLFLIATTTWGIIGMTVGLFAALQLVYPSLSFDLAFTTFGSPTAYQCGDLCICG